LLSAEKKSPAALIHDVEVGMTWNAHRGCRCGSPGWVRPSAWIVKRTLAWLPRCRRLARNLGHLAGTSGAPIRMAMIKLMARRSARSSTSRMKLKAYRREGGKKAASWGKGSLMLHLI
jgi:hypothetical protein